MAPHHVICGMIKGHTQDTNLCSYTEDHTPKLLFYDTESWCTLQEDKLYFQEAILTLPGGSCIPLEEPGAGDPGASSTPSDGGAGWWHPHPAKVPPLHSSPQPSSPSPGGRAACGSWCGSSSSDTSSSTSSSPCSTGVTWSQPRLSP